MRTCQAARAAIVLVPLLGFAGCDDMTREHRQHAYRHQGGDPAPHAPGTVAADDRATPPPPLDFALLARGQSQYRAFCVPCHAELGDGHGMVVQRGFAAPQGFGSARIRAQSTAHYVDVMTNGYGSMYSFAQRIEPADRWAIAAYVRALQRAASYRPSDLTQPQLQTLQAGNPGPLPAGVPWASTGLAP